jgi:hypothetical protein
VGRFIARAHVLSARMQRGEAPISCEPDLLPYGRGRTTGRLSPVTITRVLRSRLDGRGRQLNRQFLRGILNSETADERLQEAAYNALNLLNHHPTDEEVAMFVAALFNRRSTATGLYEDED